MTYNHENSAKVILDLCGGTGGWSAPYRRAGYTVKLIDLGEWEDKPNPVGDVRKQLWDHIPQDVHGILAAPPCTHLSGSGARWWAAKGEGVLLEALGIADACLRLVALKKPKWWALENPVGRLRRFYGPPTHIFNPNDYGDPYTKRTCLWGEFTIPEKNWVEPVNGSMMWKLPPSAERAKLRSATPPGFAKAFFEANP